MLKILRSRWIKVYNYILLLTFGCIRKPLLYRHQTTFIRKSNESEVAGVPEFLLKLGHSMLKEDTLDTQGIDRSMYN